jgi:hypothetical protein
MSLVIILKLYALLRRDLIICSVITICSLIIILFWSRQRLYWFKLTRGGGVLSAVNLSFSCCKRRFDLQLTYECVSIEIPIPDGSNLLVGNIPPNTDIKFIEIYFDSLGTKFNTLDVRVVLLGDFNVPGYDWVNGFLHVNSHYCTKLRGYVTHNAACYLVISQYKLAMKNNDPLDLW